jgi:RNA polymerase sigma-70 factor (ECF subfamily)
MSDTRPDPILPRAIAGDRQAREALVRSHGDTVWSLCSRLAQDPEDAWQEIWARALTALPRFDPAGPATFRGWLLTVAHRHLIDLHRRRVVRLHTTPLDDLHGAVDAREDLDHDRRLASLDRAIAELPDDARRTLVLHHLHGVPLADIAREEGVAIGTVKSRLHRARARLAAELGERP